ncbi:MAG: hypothetical protein CVU47_06175 [Chloroflexi bacterium HGW-Chloroflexi-9]|nr:MAG: hypothetical protein CVU47_06175 [Chloroflexi bacterium HGW-Chloroflexi-9]
MNRQTLLKWTLAGLAFGILVPMQSYGPTLTDGVSPRDIAGAAIEIGFPVLVFAVIGFWRARRSN